MRERKKERTRRLLSETAVRLFAEHGLAATTVADIAAAADVSPRTFFTYFPSKEAAVFADADAAFAGFEAAMALPRDPGRTAIDVLREFLHSWVGEHPPDVQHELCVHALRSSEPSVDAYERGLMARFEAVITAALAVDLGLDAGDLRARMVAAAAVAAMRAFEPAEGEAKQFDDPAKMAALDDALAFLKAGLLELRARD